MEHQSTEISIALLAASILFILFAGFIISFIFFYNKKKQSHFFQLKEQQKKIENEIFRSEMEIRENTLRHISEEIHDNVGQIMLLAKLNLNKFLMTNNNSEIEETRNLIGESITEMRNLTKTLHAEHISNLSLISVIEKELLRLKKTGVFETNFSVDGEVIKIESSKKLILFRMVQEILQNSIKHSKSSRVNINVAFNDNFIILNIEDNGVGFTESEKTNGADIQGSGLMNLRNRAKVLNAEFSIDSKLNCGTGICIKMPLNEN